MPLPAAPTPTHHFLERKCFIANARRKFVLVAVRCRALPRRTCDLMNPCDAATNWTFTVSDKHNTVPTFASTTATTHLTYCPLPTTPCRSTFPENAPLPILAFLHPISYRSRQAAPLPCKLAVLASRTTRNRQGRRSRSCAPSIPAHAPARHYLHHPLLCLRHQQQRARMYTVFGYHGMSLHDTLCARCHNEVRSSFSLVRALTDTQIPTVHRTANITTTPQTMRWRGPESNGEIFEVGQHGQASEDCLG